LQWRTETVGRRVEDWHIPRKTASKWVRCTDHGTTEPQHQAVLSEGSKLIAYADDLLLYEPVDSNADYNRVQEI